MYKLCVAFAALLAVAAAKPSVFGIDAYPEAYLASYPAQAVYAPSVYSAPVYSTYAAAPVATYAASPVATYAAAAPIATYAATYPAYSSYAPVAYTNDFLLKKK